MSHFTKEDWSGFLRGVVPQERAKAMQNHLDHSCKECRNSLMKTVRLLENTRDDDSYVTAADVQGAADESLEARHRRTDLLRGSRFAHLTFDSTVAPVPAGIRRSPGFSRPGTKRLLYDAAPYTLDVRIERLPGLPAAELAGQILCSSERSGPLENVGVELMRGDEAVTKTLTNAYGEFHLQFEPGKEVLVVLRLPEETIFMNLPDLT